MRVSKKAKWVHKPLEGLSRYQRNSVLYYRQLQRSTPKWVDPKKVRSIYARCRSMRKQGHRVIVDHIVPIKSKVVCGLHCEQNLQIISEPENIVKSNKWWPDCPHENHEMFETSNIQFEMNI